MISGARDRLEATSLSIDPTRRLGARQVHALRLQNRIEGFRHTHIVEFANKHDTHITLEIPQLYAMGIRGFRHGKL